MFAGWMKCSVVSLNIIYQKGNFVKHQTSLHRQSLFRLSTFLQPVLLLSNLFLAKVMS